MLRQCRDMQKSVTIQSPDLRAEILPYGATLKGLWAAGQADSLVLGFADNTDFQRVAVYAGAICGPLANRLADGRVRIGATEYQMPRNENGQTTLHSGPEGLHRREWQVRAAGEDFVTLECRLPHGACGLPGDRRIEAHYSVDRRAISLALSASSDRDTLMSLAHHPYWAVDHRARLKLRADRFLPVDDRKIPTGELATVEGTRFDMRRSAPIPEEVDHCFVLHRERRPDLERVAWLDMPNYRLRIDTDAPGLQVYSGSGLPRLPLERGLGWPVAPLSGVALEPQFFPDTPNNPSFPSVFLNAGEQWTLRQRYLLEF